MTNEVQTELSVQVVLPNEEYKALCVLVDFGCQAVALANPNVFGDQISGKYEFLQRRRLIQADTETPLLGGDEQIDVKIPFSGVVDGSVSLPRVAQYGVSPYLVPNVPWDMVLGHPWGHGVRGSKENFFNKFCSRSSSRRNQTNTESEPKKAAGHDTTAPHGTTAPRGTAQGSRAPRGSRSPQQHRTGRSGQGTHSRTPQDAQGTKHNGKQHHAATHHSKTQTARGDKTKHSAGGHRTLRPQTAPQDTTQRATAPNRAKRNNTAHNNTQPGGTTRSTTAQHSPQGHNTAHSTARHQEPPGPTRRQQRTARPNSKHANTTGHNTPASAAGAREHREEGNDAGTPAQHRTNRA